MTKRRAIRWIVALVFAWFAVEGLVMGVAYVQWRANLPTTDIEAMQRASERIMRDFR